MNVAQLYQSVTGMPTIITLEDTLWLAEQLMHIDGEQLIAEQGTLLLLLQRLELSYTDSGFMELTVQHEHRIVAFAQWLAKIRQQYQLDIHDTVIESFSLTVDEINQLMKISPP